MTLGDMNVTGPIERMMDGSAMWISLPLLLAQPLQMKLQRPLFPLTNHPTYPSTDPSMPIVAVNMGAFTALPAQHMRIMGCPPA